MAATKRRTSDEGDRPRPRAIQSHQRRAAASPRLTLKQLAAHGPSASSAGNFQDLESLLDHLGEPPVFELGKPLPSERYLPQRELGSCPAAHNRALLDEPTD
jgi:hypothetical protein